ncbi:DUF2306 domain-containing protein [Amylibacter sp. IMCC11727]|uniref:DUF2306 domain-containing protein n=1 Tax=Amylibacter sp. IMCC11727 TaxID=3039851 RepID=UPI00244E2CE1|nr:DUF2306 domain-containing protein [Amylibacter sp. IMCC11727]WGI21582.1 DUF2306 domain-containing protein [Amylibacter sp. IMCC11727]
MARTAISTALLALLIFCTLPFVYQATQLGIRGMSGTAETSRIFTPNAPITNASIFLHMLFGAIITILAPLQLSEWLRQNRPKFHRFIGRILVGLAVPTTLGGLGYIALKGTIGGVQMDVAFALYGVLLSVAAIQAARFARAGHFTRHNRWALRFFFLIIGSWIYRVHYALWFTIVGEAGHTSTFDGAFDQVQNWAFFLPYLLILEARFTHRDGPFWARHA